MNKIFAGAFALIAIVAFYGAVFHNAPWHIVTCLASMFISILFAAEGSNPKTPGLSGK
jgi:NADH:ubiquinone oxidoreductase subunit 6 (subunit J)